MKKQLLALLLLALLVGCKTTVETTPTPEVTPVPVESLTPEQVPALNIPLTDYAQAAALPEFLTAEQQAIYRGAVSLYGSMFGGYTGGIEEKPFRTGEWVSPEVAERDGSTYTLAQGCYENWADFDAAVHSVFTDSFWAGRNAAFEGRPIYRDIDGRLGYMDLGRGSGYFYNGNFPDEFRLEEQTGDTITFTLIGHYSSGWPREGESYQDRDARLLAGYESTCEFSIKMVKTAEGWRFDEFHTALADETEVPEPEDPSKVVFLGTSPDFDWEGYQNCRVMIADWFDYYAGQKNEMLEEPFYADCHITGFQRVGENEKLGAKAYLLSYYAVFESPERAIQAGAGAETLDEWGNLHTQALLIEKDGVPYGVRPLGEVGLEDMLKELEEGKESFFTPAIAPAEILYPIDPIYEVSKDMINAYLEEREKPWWETAQQLGATSIKMEMVSLRQGYQREDWGAKAYEMQLALTTEPKSVVMKMEVGGCYPDDQYRLRMEHNAVLVTVDDKPLKIVWWGSDNPSFEGVLDRYESREDLIANLSDG